MNSLKQKHIERGLSRQTLAIMLAIAFSASSAFAKSRGGTTFDFLSLTPGPRQMAMGGAGVAMDGGVFGTQLNPAALGLIWRNEISLLHTNWFEGTSYDFVGFAHPTTDHGTFAASYFTFDYGDIKAYDTNGAQDNSITAQDTAVRLSYAKTFLNRFIAGFTGAYAGERLNTQSAHAIAGDAGLIYQAPFTGLLSGMRLGLAARNFGTAPKFAQETASLPQTVQGGIAVTPFLKNITLSADATEVKDAGTTFQGGLEYVARDVAAFRVGYNSSYEIGNNLTLGLGLRVWDMQLDYAFAGFAALGKSHHIGLSYRFGSVAETYYDRGMRAMQREDYARALVEFSRVLRLDPHHRRTLLRIKEANEKLQAQFKSSSP